MEIFVARTRYMAMRNTKIAPQEPRSNVLLIFSKQRVKSWNTLVRMALPLVLCCVALELSKLVFMLSLLYETMQHDTTMKSLAQTRLQPPSLLFGE
jgi:hypothetical protein